MQRHQPYVMIWLNVGYFSVGFIIYVITMVLKMSSFLL